MIDTDEYFTRNEVATDRKMYVRNTINKVILSKNKKKRQNLRRQFHTTVKSDAPILSILCSIDIRIWIKYVSKHICQSLSTIQSHTKYS